MLMFNIIVSMIATSSLLLLVSNMSNVKINYTGRLQTNAAYEALQFDLFKQVKDLKVIKKMKDDTDDLLIPTKPPITSCNQKLRCLTNPDIDCKGEFDVTKEQPLECLYLAGEDDNSVKMKFDARNAANGFQLDGITECSEYSATTPSSICVFRPEITFKMRDCPVDPAPCIGMTAGVSKDIDLFVKIHYKSTGPYIINSTSRKLRTVISN
jgi:hypothetical protein